MAARRKWAFPSGLQQSNHETIQKTLCISLLSSTHSLLFLQACAHCYVFVFSPFFFSSLLSSFAALGCSPVSLKPISSITEIIFLPGHVFVQREWISQLSEAVENREEWLWVTAVCVCMRVCVCVFLLCALCSLAAHGCFLINASLSWRSYKERGRDGMKESYALTSLGHLRAVQSQGFG